MITLKVGPQGEELEFVVDTGAERTCLLNVPKGYSVSKDTAKVTGAKGETFTVPVNKDVVIEGETKIWMGDVLLFPKAGSNLLGRDLQVKLGIGVIPEDGKMTAKVLKLGQEDEEKINKEVWTGEGNRGGLNIDPISVTTEREDCPIRVLLTTEAAIRTKERGWIHASRIKGPVDEPKEWTITSEPGDTKLTLKWGLGGNELGRPKCSKKHTQDHT
ncbi:hypothetical protein DUI87_01503 [Hirundo rustica rustica]|uniref:Peptidase A2 domain-containing protein n=1 Tax=Hirundo rustica rustica TaxID=333673 RepID=A0A3M0L6B3_HIRRU|nr:hypothetical protein DUI87_01503 [Hirundo rustica rustica]